jgi:hypothetical protein
VEPRGTRILMKKRFVYKENCIVSDKKKNVQLEVNEEEEKKILTNILGSCADVR